MKVKVTITNYSYPDILLADNFFENIRGTKVYGNQLRIDETQLNSVLENDNNFIRLCEAHNALDRIGNEPAIDLYEELAERDIETEFEVFLDSLSRGGYDGIDIETLVKEIYHPLNNGIYSALESYKEYDSEIEYEENPSIIKYKADIQPQYITYIGPNIEKSIKYANGRLAGKTFYWEEDNGIVLYAISTAENILQYNVELI